jgi:hypothetical protein
MKRHTDNKNDGRTGNISQCSKDCDGQHRGRIGVIQRGKRANLEKYFKFSLFLERSVRLTKNVFSSFLVY